MVDSRWGYCSLARRVPLCGGWRAADLAHLSPRGYWEQERWLAAGVLIGAAVPFTLIVIMPTNHNLLATDRDPASAETRALLERWSKLHAVRFVLSLLAIVLLLWEGVRAHLMVSLSHCIGRLFQSRDGNFRCGQHRSASTRWRQVS
jgi:hypothetical protein